MKIGFCNHVFMGYLSLEEMINWAGQNNLDCLEVAVLVPPASKIIGLLDTEKVINNEWYEKSLKDLLEKNKVFISSLFYYGANMLSLNSDERKISVDGLKKAIITADKLDIPVIIISTGSPHAKPVGAINPWGIYYHAIPMPQGSRYKEEALEILTETFKPLIKFTDSYKIKIAFEPSSVGGGKGNLAFSPELLDIIFNRVPSDYLGLCYDPSHFYWMKIDYLKYLKKYASLNKVFMVHGKDAIIDKERLNYVGLLGDKWWHYRLPGWGGIDWIQVVSTLKDNGYDYVINIENEDESFGFRIDWGDLKRAVQVELVQEGILYSKSYLQGTMKALNM